MIFSKIKEWLRSKVLDAAYWMAYQQARASRLKKTDAVLILPPADGWEGQGRPYSFGDEMLMLGLLGSLESKFQGNISALIMNGQGCQKIWLHGHQIKTIGFQKGWLSLSSYKQFINIASGFSHFVVIGADVLDGAYGALNSIQRLRFLNLAAKTGMKTAITGCSFNGTKDKRIQKLLMAAEHSGTVIHAREKVSLMRLQNFLQEVISVADLAFKVNAEKYPVTNKIAEIRNQAENWKENSGLVVGINLCGWHIKDKDIFFDNFTNAILKLNDSRKNIGLILIPHDTREDGWSDIATLEAFRRKICDHIKIIGAPQDIRSGLDAKQVVRCCDVLLTGRMHLAIAAHDQGVPAVSFSYQGKFEGFYDLYNMKAEWLTTYTNPEGAVQILASAIRARKELSKTILDRKSNVHLAASQNFKWLEQ